MITKAETTDLKSIKRLLDSFGLPVSDIDKSHIEFWVYKDSGKVAGCIGLQEVGDAGLLRSLAVQEAHRGRGIGKALVQQLLRQAEYNGIKELYLLTETAAAYFSHLGFEETERESAPEEIRTTHEFSTLCSDSAICMLLKF